MDRKLAARKLSGALGQKVDPDEVESIYEEYVRLKDGRSFRLAEGNRARESNPDTYEPRFWRNGVEEEFDAFYEGLGM